MGRSRSVAIVVAYLMKVQGMDFESALSKVKKIRQDIDINPGFVEQLKVWDKIKDHWENRFEYPEYRYWIMANHAGVLSRSALPSSH